MTIRGINWMEGILALHLTAAIETKDIIGRLSQHEQSVEKALEGARPQNSTGPSESVLK